MTVSQYQPAYNYLQAQLDLCRERSHKNEIISALLKISANTDRYDQLLQHCRKNFGSSHLKSLQLIELQKALLWLDEKRHESPKKNINTFSSASVFSLLSEHPLFIAFVFLLGFFVSFFILLFMRLGSIDILNVI